MFVLIQVETLSGIARLVSGLQRILGRAGACCAVV